MERVRMNFINPFKTIEDLVKAYNNLVGVNTREVVTVNTYTQALQEAKGDRFKEIIVLQDETDGGNQNSYKYNKIEGELELIF